MTKYDMTGIREDLSNVIYNISPEETPFMSGAGKGPKAKQTLTEWQTDTLAAATTDNAQLEGDDITSFPTLTSTVRVGNYQQISRKLVAVSDTADEVDAAGRESEEAYQLAKKGAELKLDMEKIFLHNQAGAAGSSTVARTLAGMGAWCKANVDKGTGAAANPTYTSGVPGAARTDGTQRAFTETILKAVIQSVWTNGGKARTLLAGPVNKTKVSAFSGIATRNFDMSNVSPKPTAIIAAADVYVSDFGTVRVLPSRHIRERDAYLIDWDLIDVSYLRPFKKKALAVTGDASKTMLIVEYTLRVKQEAGLGLACDLTTT